MEGILQFIDFSPLFSKKSKTEEKNINKKVELIHSQHTMERKTCFDGDERQHRFVSGLKVCFFLIQKQFF